VLKNKTDKKFIENYIKEKIAVTPRSNISEENIT
jgi:hypothetical protein